MAEESMKVVIGADVNQGVAGIQRFNKEIAKVKPGTASATLALTNLGRVAQDVPFGFIGIANNLNPLLESFQRLRAESGSNVAALKALGSSLIGGGGLGLALSAVTAILSFASVGLSAWTKGTKQAKEDTDDFAKSIKNIADLQDEAISSVQGQIATVNALAAVVTNANKPYEERKRALQELREINKSYFGDLTLESDKLGLLSARVQDYTKAIIQQAIVKKFSDEIANTAEAFSKQEKAVEKARLKVEQARRAEEAWFIAQGKLASAANGNTQDEIAARKVLTEENNKLTDLGVQRIDQTHELNKAVEAGLKLKDLEVEPTKKIKEEEEKIRHARILSLEALKEQQQILDTISGKITPKTTAVTPTGAILPSIQLKPGLGISQPLTEAEKLLEQFNARIKDIVKDIGSTIVEGFGTAFGEALAGGGLGSLLSGFLGTLADAAIQLGKIAIGVGVAMLGIKAAFESLNPAVAIAAGVALVALGSFVKSKISKMHAFAEGGIVTKPTLGLFGEAGPEAVIPLHKMNGLMGNNVNVQGEFRIRGRDLVAVVAQGEKTLNRIT